MKGSGISKTIQMARQGDPGAMMELLELLRPLIDRYSRINGVRDDDLSQYLIIQVLSATQSFEC